jgi:hypothetical protein
MFWGIFIFAVVVGLLLFKLTVEIILRALQIAPKHIMHFQLYYALFLVITIGITVYTLLQDISNLLISFSVQPTRVASTETNRAEYANVTDTIDWATADARATTDAIARATANTRATTDAYAGATADARATTDAIIRATADARATTNAIIGTTTNARATDDAKTRAIIDTRSTTDALAKTEADNELNNTPTPCPSIANPYGLERLQLQKLGCAAQDWVPSRLIVVISKKLINSAEYMLLPMMAGFGGFILIRMMLSKIHHLIQMIGIHVRVNLDYDLKTQVYLGAVLVALGVFTHRSDKGLEESNQEVMR